MSYNPTALDIKLSKAKKRTYQIKVELLNRDMKIIEEIQGELISGSRKIDGNSDIRRTCNLSFYVKNKEYTIGENSKFSSDRMIRLWYGVYSITTKEYVWYDYGTYGFTTSSLNYSSESNVLSVNCVDLMYNLIKKPISNAKYLIIEKGMNIREAMEKYIKEICKINNYIIPEMYPIYNDSAEAKTLPYELSYGVGTSAYECIKEIRDIYPGYETYFEGGAFICQRIPMLNKDDPFLTDANFSELVIEETNDIDTEAIKNITEVWGNDEGGSQVHVIVCLVDTEPDEEQKADNIKDWNCNSIKYIVNPKNKYTVEKIGEVWNVKNGGVFDYIGTEELALERAEWENYRASIAIDTITLTIISIPWLDVNKKIEYTVKSSGITNMYIIKSISENLGSGLMDLELIRFYPDYTGIVD